MQKNTAKDCDHEWRESLEAAGLEKCVWCPATREASAAVRPGVDVPVGAEVVQGKRAA